MVFSLPLPVYLVLARWHRGWWAVKLVGLLGVVPAAYLFGRQELLYLAMFAFGVLMAQSDRITAAAAAVSRARAADWSRRRASSC